MVIRSVALIFVSCFVFLGSSAATAQKIFTDDFSGGLNLPWVFIDDLANSPPDFADVIYNDVDQDLKILGSASAYQDDFLLNVSSTAYVGLGDDAYFFEDEVHVSATFSPLENITLGFDDLELGNNDMFVVVRGDGLTGYVFALDTFHAEADIVRVDDGTVVGLGDEAILRDLQGINQGDSYTLTFSAIDNVLTGMIFDEAMTLLGEVSIEEDSYDSGWAGVGTAVNDAGDEAFRTLLATSFDNFSAADTLDINVEPVTIDELTAAINSGEMDSRFDIDQNGIVNAEDRTAWVTVLTNTYFGDANLDGEFNSADFVAVFQAGEYEDGIADNSLWADGDWNGDGDFDSGDFVLAFQGGGYELGPRPVASVPEPSAVVLFLLGCVTFLTRRRDVS